MNEEATNRVELQLQKIYMRIYIHIYIYISILIIIKVSRTYFAMKQRTNYFSDCETHISGSTRLIPNLSLNTELIQFFTHPILTICLPKICSIARAERDGTRAETRFLLSLKRTSPFKSVGASVQSTAGSRGVRISLSNAGYTTFGGGVRVLATHSIRQFPLHFPSRVSQCATRFRKSSNTISPTL